MSSFILPPRAPTPPSSSSSSFPQPPSFSSSPSKNRRAPPSFPPNSKGQPYASSSTFRFKEHRPSSLNSPTTPAAVRVSPPTPRRRESSDRGSSPSDESKRPMTPREVYSGAVPSNRPRSNTVERAGGGGGLAEVPREYAIALMRQLAPKFWKKDNYDCTIRKFIPSSIPTPVASSSKEVEMLQAFRCSPS